MKLIQLRLLNIFAVALISMFAVVACTDEDPVDETPDTGTSTETPTGGAGTATPTQDAGGGAGTATPTQGAGGGGSPTPGGEVEGDADAGEELFTSLGCSGCHSTSDVVQVGPGLGGVYERADERVAGLSAEEYIEQSLREPSAHVVEGFQPGVMPDFSDLTDDEVQNLIAYLRTLE